MKKILVMAVLFCSFIIINPVGAEEGKNNPDPVVAETHDLERYKDILKLHHAEKIDPIPSWHKYSPKEVEDSRCSRHNVNPHDGTVTCPGINLMDW